MPNIANRFVLLAFVVPALFSCSSADAGTAPRNSGIKPGADARAQGAISCTGKPGAVRGKTNQSVVAAGVSRTFVLYEPPTLDPNTPAPIVFVFHGWTMSGQAMYDLTQYNAVADREGVVIAYPDGEPGAPGPWNVGSGVCSPGDLGAATGDDSSFIDAMLQFIEADQCVDRRHVFATGFSMGGYFSHEIGCTRPDFAGVAPHSGGTHPFDTCTPGHKPVIIFHGTADTLIPTTCDDTSRAQWVQKNGCGPGVDSKPVKGGTCEYSQECPPDGQVVYCKFDGMRHQWAGGAPIIGNPNYESATELGWAFFKQYAW